MRVSKIVRGMTEDETVFPFGSLAVEPGKSWRKKARAFKSADWIGALGEAPFTARDAMSRGAWQRIIPRLRGRKLWDAHMGGVDV